MIRPPAVAGSFYDLDSRRLASDIEQCFLGRLGPGKLPVVPDTRTGNVLGLVCPHAGYIYSGGAAAHAFAALAQDGLPDTVVIMGPNHWGLGEPVAIAAHRSWQTPLGSVDIDTETADLIGAASKYAASDTAAHVKEHSIEVLLPFLQFLDSGRTRIVPIAIAHMSLRDMLLVCDDLGAAIASAVRGKSACVISSTDLTHQKPAAAAHADDAKALEQIIALDGPGLIRTVDQHSISMCGAVGTAAMLRACVELGATGAKKLAYYTSGDVETRMREVVGYGALSVTR